MASRDPVAALVWHGDSLSVLDQTALPHREQWVRCFNAADVTEAIIRLVIWSTS